MRPGDAPSHARAAPAPTRDRRASAQRDRGLRLAGRYMAWREAPRRAVRLRPARRAPRAADRRRARNRRGRSTSQADGTLALAPHWCAAAELVHRRLLPRTAPRAHRRALPRPASPPTRAAAGGGGAPAPALALSGGRVLYDRLRRAARAAPARAGGATRSRPSPRRSPHVGALDLGAADGHVGPAARRFPPDAGARLPGDPVSVGQPRLVLDACRTASDRRRRAGRPPARARPDRRARGAEPDREPLARARARRSPRCWPRSPPRGSAARRPRTWSA